MNGLQLRCFMWLVRINEGFHLLPSRLKFKWLSSMKSCWRWLFPKAVDMEKTLDRTPIELPPFLPRYPSTLCLLIFFVFPRFLSLSFFVCLYLSVSLSFCLTPSFWLCPSVSPSLSISSSLQPPYLSRSSSPNSSPFLLFSHTISFCTQPLPRRPATLPSINFISLLAFWPNPTSLTSFFSMRPNPSGWSDLTQSIWFRLSGSVDGSDALSQVPFDN